MALLYSEREPDVPVEETRGHCGVRRSLFGPVDHQQLQQDFQRLLHMSVDMATRRWDFDFLSDRPTTGSTIEWEELRCQDVPAFYHSCVVKAVKSNCQRGETITSTSSSCSTSPDHSSSEESPQQRCRGIKRSFSALGSVAKRSKCRQAAITDFFTVRKRRRLHHKALLRQ